MFLCEHDDIVFRCIGMMEMSWRNMNIRIPVSKNLINIHIVGKILNVQAPECPLQVKLDGTPGPFYDVTCILPPLQHVAVMCDDRQPQAYYTCSMH